MPDSLVRIILDNQYLLTVALLAVGLSVLWFARKLLRKLVLAFLVMVAVAGIALGLYLKLF